MKFNPIEQGKQVPNLSTERKSLIEIRMEMIALLLSRRGEGENEKNTKTDA
ncbi:MAG: hypothetical protein K0Q63_541 [Paenibacillus sp.]|nr:hypothetical protein [Paenibacillus sp.]